MNFSKSDKLTILEMKVSEMKNLLIKNEIKAEELISLHIDQVEKFNKITNAICTFIPDQAISKAKEMDLKNDFELPLSGIPTFIKDLTATKGIRTTYGSRIYSENVPIKDDLIVERIKNSGAIIMGKSNTPEFGAGSQTFNDVFGTTNNPYDTSKTCGGSSGGAAVALACRMAPIAQGSDMGGSLRNPAAWNNVVGFRTSQGRVPNWPYDLPYNSLSVNGPMARTVDDTSLFLSVMAGYDPRFATSINEDPKIFETIIKPSDKKILRVAYTEDLNIYPVDKDIKKVFNQSISVLSKLGIEMENAAPNLPNVDNVFQIYRAYSFAHSHKNHIKNHRDLMKDTLVWNVEKGMNLSILDMAEAESQRSVIISYMSDFFKKYDYLLLPTTSVLPFGNKIEYVDEIDGIKLNTYIDWMGLCYAITVTGYPSINVPCGFSDKGLPVGMQIVGKEKNELGVLQFAKLFENNTNFYKQKPNIIL